MWLDQPAKPFHIYFGYPFGTNIIFLLFSSAFGPPQILCEDETEGDLDMYQPKEVKEEYIKREERKLGMDRVSTTCIHYLLLCPPRVSVYLLRLFCTH